MRKWQLAGFKSWEAYLRAYNKKKMRAWYLKNREMHLARIREYKLRTKEEREYKEWYEKEYLKK